MKTRKSRYLPMFRLVPGEDEEYLKCYSTPAKRQFRTLRRGLMYGNLRCLRKEVICLRKKVNEGIRVMQMPSDDYFVLYWIKYWTIKYLAAKVGVKTFFRLNPTNEIIRLIEVLEVYKALALKEPEVGI